MTVPSFSASASFFGGPTKVMMVNPVTIRIIQREYAIDVAKLVFWAGDANSTSFVSGTPMVLTWGRPNIKRAFYGYVNHVERTSNAHTADLIGRNSVTVICAGTAWPMHQTGTLAWFNVTASQVITQIAQLFGFDTSAIKVHQTIWENLQMAGKTFWQFCCDLAKRVGYAFYANGPQLVFSPRQTNPNQLSTLADVYDYRAAPDRAPVFKPVLGAASPAGGQLRTRQLSSLDPVSLQPITLQTSGSPQTSLLGSAADDPLFIETEHMPVRSVAEAQARLNGVALLNQFYIQASAHVIGNPMLAQGSLVYVQNANGSQNGLWYIQEAEHNLNASTYATDLSLGRDSLGSASALAMTPRVQSLPATKLSGQLWKAA